MLTSYWVRCPHSGCGWFGSLLPSSDADSFRGAIPKVKQAAFECPNCHGEWRGRIIGDDVENLPLEQEVLPLA